MRHFPFVIRKTSELLKAFSTALPSVERLQLGVGLDLTLMGATGLEPVTPSVSSKDPPDASGNQQELTTNPSDRCTSGCPSGPETGSTQTVEALAAALLGLSPTDR